MQELITRLTEKAGISAEQASKAIDAVKDFVKEKFPMMGGAVDNLLSGKGEEAATAFPVAATDPTVPAPEHAEGHSMLDKISDVIPGETGQKVEDFAKNVADKAEDLFDAAKDKVSGLFGDKK
jgi:hypothetical protein